jgi:SAM-dependent methyltransferase
VSEPEWQRANRAHWDELVGVHLGARGYDLSGLRSGRGRLTPIEEAELPELSGKRILHLQCHFGADSLCLAQRGAEVVGLDFSKPAIEAAWALAAELGLGHRASFVQAELYDAPAAVPRPHLFDLVFVTWGAICWLPDIARWGRTVAAMLRPGGSLYLADGHPAAYVFDDERRQPDGMPGFFAPYFSPEPVVAEAPKDYADPQARLANTTIHNWIHPLGAVVASLLASGFRLDRLNEHDAVPWPMFSILTKDPQGLYRWPGERWLPLAFSLSATLAQT